MTTGISEEERFYDGWVRRSSYVNWESVNLSSEGGGGGVHSLDGACT